MSTSTHRCVYPQLDDNVYPQLDYNHYNVYPQVYGIKCIDEEQEGMDTGTSGPDGLPPPGCVESRDRRG